MKLRWGRDGDDYAVLSVDGVEGIEDSAGWVMPVVGGYALVIEATLSPEQMDCEKVTYPTRKHAMRELGAVVTALIIGGHHEA
jgi:hypothetical protein